MNNPQQIAELIRIQTTLQKISIRQMLKEIGLGVNSLSHMDNGSMPKADNLGKVADYLGVSVDYLLGRTDESEYNSISISEQKQNNFDEMSTELLKKFNELSFDEKLEVFNYIKNIKEK